MSRGSHTRATFADKIDWGQPWLAPFQEVGKAIAAAPHWRDELNRQSAQRNLRNYRDLPIQFVPQAELPEQVAYEEFIGATGKVPTRDNLHDFFNALVWLSFPRIKSRLNALQANEIEQAQREDALQEAILSGGGAKKRGRLRDAATIFDENAALFITGDSCMIADLREHRWNELFLERADTFHHTCEVLLFGHALIEKLTAPYKAITAHTWSAVVDTAVFSLALPSRLAAVDAAVEQQLTADLTTSNFSPLPVLGVPGWNDGQDSSFYADKSVFRPKRGVKTSGRNMAG